MVEARGRCEKRCSAQAVQNDPNLHTDERPVVIRVNRSIFGRWVTFVVNAFLVNGKVGSTDPNPGSPVTPLLTQIAQKEHTTHYRCFWIP